MTSDPTVASQRRSSLLGLGKASHRLSASLERASRGALSVFPSKARQAVVESLQCLVCLDVVQLPVNITCFPGCPGTHARANNTCLRGALCQHCANDALQLSRPPSERFLEEGGRVRCMICRDTAADARQLTPVSSYVVNHSLMDVMDAVDVGATCRKCDLEFPTQALLQAHYLKHCPHAVVQCRFKGCPQVAVRPLLEAHQDLCAMGRAVCQQCHERLDKDELVYHMVALCRMRIVVCVLCSHRARLPDMLLHLRLHQAQLQLQILQKGAKPVTQQPQRSNARGMAAALAPLRAIAGTGAVLLSAADPVAQRPQHAQQWQASPAGATSHAVAVALRPEAAAGAGPGSAAPHPAPVALNHVPSTVGLGLVSTAVANTIAAAPGMPVAVQSPANCVPAPAPAVPAAGTFDRQDQEDHEAVQLALAARTRQQLDATLPHTESQEFGTELDVYLAAAALERHSSSSQPHPVGSRRSGTGQIETDGGRSRSSYTANTGGSSSSLTGLQGTEDGKGSDREARLPVEAAVTLLPGSMLPANQHQMLHDMLQRLRRRHRQQEQTGAQAQRGLGQAQEWPQMRPTEHQQQRQHTPGFTSASAPQLVAPQSLDTPAGSNDFASPTNDDTVKNAGLNLASSGDISDLLQVALGAVAPIAAPRQLHTHPAAGSVRPPDVAAGQADLGMHGMPMLFTIGPSLFRRRSSDLANRLRADSDALAPKGLDSSRDDTLHSVRESLSAGLAAMALAANGKEPGTSLHLQQPSPNAHQVQHQGRSQTEVAGFLDAATLGLPESGGVDIGVFGASDKSEQHRHSRHAALLQHPQLSLLRTSGVSSIGPGSDGGAAQHPHLPWASVGGSPFHPGTPRRRRAGSLELHRRPRRLSDSEAVEASRQELAAASQAVAAMLLCPGAQ